jgi:hypothetical protein
MVGGQQWNLKCGQVCMWVSEFEFMRWLLEFLWMRIGKSTPSATHRVSQKGQNFIWNLKVHLIPIKEERKK